MTKIDAIARAMSAAARSASYAAGEGSHDSDEVRAFVQQRVASFALLLAVLFAGFFVWRASTVLLTYDEAVSARTYLVFQGGGVLVMATVWLLLRRQARPLRFVRATEIIGLGLGSASLVLMCIYIPYPARPDFILVQALTVLLLGRSIYVPSRARSTLLIGGLLTVAILPASYLIHLRGHDPAIYTTAAGDYLRVTAPQAALRGVVVNTLWWATAVTIATAASKVIYGLRALVRDARRLGQYTLHEKLGAGGMGEVYRASHAMLRRPTAIKLLPPDKLGEDSVARFEREVQLTALLTHPNTVRVFDYGRTPDRVFYYAMEFLDGASLTGLVAEAGPLPPGRVIHLLEQCTGALAEAHEIGLIHRDIKPANILVTEQGGQPDVAKVVDFGLVKTITAESVPAEARTLEAVSRADAVTGTPQYMAPEAITSPEQIDARTDLYALGAVGYFLLTGVDVFSGRSILEICGHHLHSEPQPPSARLGRPVAPDLERLILACLAKDPGRRPASARELRAALRACADSGSWSEETARAWWRQHGAALRARVGADGELGGASTLAVDFARRAG